MAPAKIRIPREIKDILGPLKEAMVNYQQALPIYMEGMKVKFPPQPPMDLDCNERRMRDSLLILAQKLEAERDDDAIWRKNRDQELAVKADVIARREEIANPYRALLREMEGANERLRNTQRLIIANRKQMDELKGEMEEMNAWIHSGEPATKEMLRSVGLVRKSCSLACQGAATPKVKDVRRNSARSTCSWKSEGGARTASSQSSGSSRFSTSPSRSRHNAAVARSSVSTSTQPSCDAATTPRGVRGGASVTFKTRRAPKLARAPRRAEYCPVGNEVSFRKKTRVARVASHEGRPSPGGHARASSSGSRTQQQQHHQQPQPQPKPQQQQRVVSSSTSSCAAKPRVTAERGARARVASLGGGNVRTVPMPSRTGPSEASAAAATNVKRPNASGVARARRRTPEPAPRAGAGGGPRWTSPNTAKGRPVGVVARRPISSPAEVPKVRKRPPWRPMA